MEKENEISFGRFGEGLVLSITVFPFDLLQRRHTPVILEYGLKFPPTSCHKYELVFLGKMFFGEIEIDFLVCCNTVSLILTSATPNFSCSQKKKKKKNCFPKKKKKKKLNLSKKNLKKKKKKRYTRIIH